MQDGKEGRLKQCAIENIIKYADVLGAGELCVVTKATLFCGKHEYLNSCEADCFDEMFSKAQLAKDDEVIKFDSIHSCCQAQSDVGPCESSEYKALSQSKALFEENGYYLERAREAGVTIAGTCAPYLNGWLPLPGEHFVTTESGMTIIGNSLWGACCNSDGIEAAFWSAICGRTPKWGKHTREGRMGNIAVDVRFTPKDKLEWDLLGKAVGDKLPPHSVPVLTGDFSHSSFNNIRQFLTALAISSNCELCHIPGITYDFRTPQEAFGGKSPENNIVITSDDVEAAYRKVCDDGESKVGLVILGCPHYDILQIKQASEYIKGKKTAGVDFQIWTSYPIKMMAEMNGYLSVIEQAGGRIYTGSCPTSIGSCLFSKHDGFAFDSLKQSVTSRLFIDRPNYVGSMESCVDAAISGEWKEQFRWKKR